jgi:anti-anti-sigma factor
MTAGVFSVRWAGPLVAVTLPAEIDLSNSAELRATLNTLINAAPETVVVDMTRTAFADSATIAILVRASQQAASRQVRLRVAASDVMLRLLRLLEADRLIEVYPGLAEALGDAAPGPLHARWAGAEPGPPADEAG